MAQKLTGNKTSIDNCTKMRGRMDSSRLGNRGYYVEAVFRACEDDAGFGMSGLVVVAVSFKFEPGSRRTISHVR